MHSQTSKYTHAHFKYTATNYSWLLLLWHKPISMSTPYNMYTAIAYFTIYVAMLFPLHCVVYLHVIYTNKLPTIHYSIEDGKLHVKWIYEFSSNILLIILYILPLKHLDTSLKPMKCVYTIKNITAIQIAIDLIIVWEELPSSKDKWVCIILKEMSN